MTTAAKPRVRVFTKFVCARCGRRLRRDHYTTSKFTGNRFCWRQGCDK